MVKEVLVLSFRVLTIEEINLELFAHFRRHQIVERCYHKDHKGNWMIKSEPFIDDWSVKQYSFLVERLINTIKTGGFVYGAFVENELKGFASVESEIFDNVQQYADLTSLHVSDDMRRHGIGKGLFGAAKQWTK